tara:strand:- start:541 stop:726 length:186 start_codon:yes stop_codon:yes gene_type:complete
MAEVQVTMVDVETVLNSTPAFAQAVRGAALARRVDELEAEKAEAPICDCMKGDLSEDEQEV